jgi:hypothetical protein
VFFFWFISFGSGRKAHLRRFQKGSTALVRVVGGVLGQTVIFKLLFFLRQIYSFMSTSVRHAPFSCDFRRPLVLSPQVTVVWSTGDRRGVITCQ